MQLKLDAAEKVRKKNKRQKDAECRLSLNAGKSTDAGKSKECNANLVTGWYPGRIYTTFIKMKKRVKNKALARAIRNGKIRKFTAKWQALFIDGKDKEQREEDRA